MLAALPDHPQIGSILDNAVGGDLVIMGDDVDVGEFFRL
jgi:hypothetical protein